MPKITIREVAIYVVIAMWIVVVIANIIDHTYQVPALVQVAMTGVLTYVLGNEKLRPKPNGNHTNAPKQNDNRPSGLVNPGHSDSDPGSNI